MEIYKKLYIQITVCIRMDSCAHKADLSVVNRYFFFCNKSPFFTDFVADTKFNMNSLYIQVKLIA